MSWTEITELISPSNNCWQLPVTTENQCFPRETVCLIANSQGCSTPPCLRRRMHINISLSGFAEVACMEWQHYNRNLQTTEGYTLCRLLLLLYVQYLLQGSTTKPSYHSARGSPKKWRDSEDWEHYMVFLFLQPSQNIFTSTSDAHEPLNKHKWRFWSTAGIILRGYNFRQSALSL